MSAGPRQVTGREDQGVWVLEHVGQRNLLCSGRREGLGHTQQGCKGGSAPAQWLEEPVFEARAFEGQKL